MNEFIYSLIRLIIVAAVLLITRYLVPFLKTKIDAEKMELICNWADTAVRCAEQVCSGAAGTDKKAIVTEFLKHVLTAKNITLSDTELDTLIEACVQVMNEELGDHSDTEEETTDNTEETADTAEGLKEE